MADGNVPKFTLLNWLDAFSGKVLGEGRKVFLKDDHTSNKEQGQWSASEDDSSSTIGTVRIAAVWGDLNKVRGCSTYWIATNREMEYRSHV